MPSRLTQIQYLGGSLTLVILSGLLQSCFFFKKRSADDDSSTQSVIGAPLGDRAGSAIPERLSEIYAISSPYAPAAVRPDPDTMVRQLLLQYREPSATVAREIGRVEKFRLLLGGASEDFSTPAQESYDATSLLATMKVAEEVCLGLVAPTSSIHGSWTTILPAPPSDVVNNVRFLVQRITGIPSADISAESQSALVTIADAAKVSGAYTNNSYVPVCAALVMDAEALLL